MTPLCKAERKAIKQKLFEVFGYRHKWDFVTRDNAHYSAIIKNTIGVSPGPLTKAQGRIGLRFIADSKEEDFKKVLLDSLNYIPKSDPVEYVDRMIANAVISRKMQRLNSPIMSEAQKRSEVINDYVHRKEVERFSDKHFYRSREWKELRLLALSAGRVCKLCGCGPAQGKAIHVDHIKPRSLWPELSLDISNLQILCQDCNMAKSNTIVERY